MARERLVPFIVATALFMENMDATMMAVSLPAIAADIGTEPLTLRLAIISYLVSLAVLIPASGWIADRFGARNVFRLAIVVFMLGSLACALSPSLPLFILARVIQGMGAALMTPVGRLVMVRSIGRERIVSAIALLSMGALIGPIVGPPLGGFLTTYASWHWIFIINIPIGIAGIIFVTVFIDDVPTHPPGRFDVLGMLLSAGGLAGLAFGFSVLGLAFIPRWVQASLIVGGAILTAGYVFHARRHPAPLLDLRLLRFSTFRASIYGGFLFRAGIGALPFLLPLMLQLGFNFTPFQSGLVTLAVAIGAFQMKAIIPWILARLGFRTTLIWNGVLTAATLAACALFTPETPYAVMIAVLVVHGVFRSLQFTSVNSIGFAEIDAPDMGRATPFLAVTSQLSQTAGVAMGAIAVDAVSRLGGNATPSVADFHIAFILVSLFSLTSLLVFRAMPRDAGANLHNRPRS
ncbi:MAG TPA: MFS transporter [Xanthobacteraceae bacterium]|nr:MFS transporter [Xanthobacteraceae bacterium]